MNKKQKSRISWIVYGSVVLMLWLTGWHLPMITKIQQIILTTELVPIHLEQEQSKNKVDAAFIDENNKKVNLSDLRGDIVFLNIWATWCPPCKAEMPSIQELYESSAAENISFVLLSTDRNFEKAKQFKRDNNYTFPIYSLAGNLSNELSSSALPTTFVIGKNGAIKMIHEGMAYYNSQEFKDYLKRLNNEI